MQTFIQQLAAEISDEELQVLRKRAYIFPTRRGVLLFTKELTKRSKNKTFWPPLIMSIQDFVEYVTRRKVSDPMTLLFELYEVYMQHDKDEHLDTFDKFYAWGEVLLKDFDEIDKYLVDANALYEDIYEIKEIESWFGADEEAIQAIQQFRNVLSGEEKTHLQQKFLHIWQIVGEVYHAFKQRLRSKKLAYEGMLYRSLVNLFKENRDRTGLNEIYFCGFNALSNAEEEILDTLFEQKRAVAYWDVDKIYMENEWHEAGMFLRRYKEKWPTERSRWIEGDMLQDEKNVQIIQTIQSMGQTKIAADLLTKEIDATHIKEAKTVLVLADENLLLPSLYALPSNVTETNVTMGYPAFNNPLCQLMNLLIDLQINRSGKGENSYYKNENINAFLKNPYIQNIAGDDYPVYYDWMLKNRRRYLGLEEIKETLTQDLIQTALEPQILAKDVLEHLIQIMRDLFEFYLKEHQNKAEKIQKLSPTEKIPELTTTEKPVENEVEGNPELDFIFHFIKHLIDFQENIAPNIHKISIALLRRMLNENLKTLKIPFTGDAQKGLQIMGFLETRTLDFENLFILSVNEGQLPTERKINSFIPYNLRKTFSMPTFEEQDAIYCYHFYRLLQRAKKVYLIYDSEAKAQGTGGEKSRFIGQLSRLIKRRGNTSKIRIEEKMYGLPVPANTAQHTPIQVIKTPAIMEKLENYLYRKGKQKEDIQYFSPTAIGTYLDCSLRFYFRYIARLYELEDYSEHIEAVDLGDIVHQTMELLYRSFTHKTVTEEMLKPLLNEGLLTARIESILLEKKFIKESFKELTGRNMITFNIILKIVKSVVQKDIEYAPFIVHSVENRAKQEWIQINESTLVFLNGIIDRVDEPLNDEVKGLRIIDYKTGKVELFKQRKESDEEYIEKYFADPRYKAGFQAYFYAWLYYKQNSTQNIKAGIYHLKEINKGIKMLRNNQLIDQSLLIHFEDLLREKLQELFNFDAPFVQTEDVTRCEFCTYKDICFRKLN